MGQKQFYYLSLVEEAQTTPFMSIELWHLAIGKDQYTLKRVGHPIHFGPCNHCGWPQLTMVRFAKFALVFELLWISRHVLGLDTARNPKKLRSSHWFASPFTSFNWKMITLDETKGSMNIGLWCIWVYKFGGGGYREVCFWRHKSGCHFSHFYGLLGDVEGQKNWFHFSFVFLLPNSSQLQKNSGIYCSTYKVIEFQGQPSIE